MQLGEFFCWGEKTILGKGKRGALMIKKIIGVGGFYEQFEKLTEADRKRKKQAEKTKKFFKKK